MTRISSSISVIIPAYNSARTIKRAIESVMSQSIPPKEIIVVDDGSTDSTCNLVESLFPSVILIRQKNSGAAAARNTGVKQSKGDLIAFLDSDDFWHRRKIEYQSKLFEDDPLLGICSTKCKFIFESEGLNAPLMADEAIEACSSQAISFEKMFQLPFLGTPSVMMKRSVYDSAGGFDDSLETAEDVDLWIKATYLSHYKLIINTLTYVVAQEESLSSRAQTSPYAAHLTVIDNFLKEKTLSFYFRHVIAKQTQAYIYCNWGSNLLVRDLKKEAKEKLIKSLTHFPNLRAIYLLSKIILKFS